MVAKKAEVLGNTDETDLSEDRKEKAVGLLVRVCVCVCSYVHVAG